MEKFSVPAYTKTLEIVTFGKSLMNIETSNIETRIREKIPC